MKKLIIYSLLSQKKKNQWKKIELKWKKYFIIEHKIYSPSKLKSLAEGEEKIHTLFFDYDNINDFKTEYYHIFKNKENHFRYIAVSDKPRKTDSIAFKSLVDDIVYLNSDNSSVAWKTISILRRSWNTHSTGNTIIYKGIIADFADSYIEVERKEKDLTSKELKLLRYFMQNNGEYLSRDKIFQDVWKIEDKDSTRTLDQMLFKLKKKIGNQYFTTSRKYGVKFE